MSATLDGKQIEAGTITSDKFGVGAVAAIIVATVPPTTEGVDGDFYIDKENGLMYGPKASGVWPEGFSVGGISASDKTLSGRFRVANPQTLFESKLLFSKQSHFWDESTTGAGASIAHDTNHASVLLSVSNLTAGKAIRQSLQWFNYQGGKTFAIEVSGVMVAATGIVCEVGYFETKNGLFFRVDDGAVSIVLRSGVTGSPVDVVIPQAAWDDPLDGTGASGATLDIETIELFIIELDVTTVRFGLHLDGHHAYVHELSFANTVADIFMSTSNLPIRFSIENKGTGAAAQMRQITAAIQSDGGHNPQGLPYTSRNADLVTSLSSGSTYALIGVRCASASEGINILVRHVSIMLTTPTDYGYWEIRFDPVVAGTFTYTPVAGTAAEVAIATTNANTVTGGTPRQGQFAYTQIAADELIFDPQALGFKIDGTPQTAVLCFTPYSSSISAAAALTWQEMR